MNKKYTISINEDVNRALDHSLLVLRVQYADDVKVSFYKPAAFIRAYSAYLEKVRYNSIAGRHVEISLSMTEKSSKDGTLDLFEHVLFLTVL